MTNAVFPPNIGMIVYNYLEYLESEYKLQDVSFAKMAITEVTYKLATDNMYPKNENWRNQYKLDFLKNQSKPIISVFSKKIRSIFSKVIFVKRQL